MHTKAA